MLPTSENANDQGGLYRDLADGPKGFLLPWFKGTRIMGLDREGEALGVIDRTRYRFFDVDGRLLLPFDLIKCPDWREAGGGRNSQR